MPEAWEDEGDQVLQLQVLIPLGLNKPVIGWMSG